MANGNPTKRTTLMSINKICPQCGSAFEGRSNQLYCTSACKQRAFQAGKTQRTLIPEPVSVRTEVIASPPVDPQTARVYKALRLDSLERMKRLEMEEREQEREFERDREEREFSKERERVKWDLDLRKLDLRKQVEPPADQSLAGGLPATPDKEDDASSEIGLGEVVAVGVVEYLIAKWLGSRTPGQPVAPPQPHKPPFSLMSASSPPAPPAEETPKTDTKTDFLTLLNRHKPVS